MLRTVLLLLVSVGCSGAKPATSTVPPPGSVAWEPTKLPPNASLCVSLTTCVEDAERAAPLACSRIGDLVDNGALAAVSDLTTLEPRLHKICETSDADCCAEAAKLHCDPPGPGSWDACRPTARALFELGCSKGDTYACMGLSIVTRRGLGGAADTEEAQRIVDRATVSARAECDGGDGLSCALARQLLDVAYDDAGAKEAQRRFNLAAEASCAANDGLACAALARVYGGASETSDESKSRLYLERACKLGVDLRGCASSGQ